MSTLQPLWSFLSSIPVTSVVIILLILATTALILLSVVVIRLESRIRYLATPVYDQIVEEAREKAKQVLRDAEDQGRELLTAAHAQTEKIIESYKVEDLAYQEEMRRLLEAQATRAKGLLDQQTATVTELLASVQNQFKAQAIAAEKALSDESGLLRQAFSNESEHMKQIFSHIASDMEKEYQILVKDTKKHLSDEVAKEVELARAAIVSYKHERLRVVNQEIVGLVEDTARIALNKSLSLEDHRGIILDALAEAKRKGVFGT